MNPVDSMGGMTDTELDQLFLTRLNGLVQLRTQFHHLDAVNQLEAAQRRREKESQEGAKVAEPKAFMPTVKKAGGDTAAEITQSFMKSANAEKWNRLTYQYEDVRASTRPKPIADIDRRPLHLMTPSKSVSSCQNPTRPRSCTRA